MYLTHAQSSVLLDAINSDDRDGVGVWLDGGRLLQTVL